MGEVVLSSFNPYSDRYPNRRVITREQLHLSKILRAQGLQVRVGGVAKYELNYLAVKGLREWLGDPIVVVALSMPLGVISGFIGNALYDLVKGRKPKPTDVLIELDESGSRSHYASDGRPLSQEEFTTLVSSMNGRYRIAHPAPVNSPDPARPVPVYLEHMDRIVAWGRLAIDDYGLRVDDARVVDDETWERLSDGSLSGMSIGALVRKSRCSVCGQSYFDCPHLSGEQYDGVPCVVHIEDLDLGEVSIVRNPVNPSARITRLGPDSRDVG